MMAVVAAILEPWWKWLVQLVSRRQPLMENDAKMCNGKLEMDEDERIDVDIDVLL
jgi:hypothetical protein